MKKLVLILFVAVLFSACKGKKNEVVLDEVTTDSTLVQIDSLISVDSAKVDTLK